MIKKTKMKLEHIASRHFVTIIGPDKKYFYGGSDTVGGDGGLVNLPGGGG